MGNRERVLDKVVIILGDLDSPRSDQKLILHPLMHILTPENSLQDVGDGPQRAKWKLK